MPASIRRRAGAALAAVSAAVVLAACAQAAPQEAPEAPPAPDAGSVATASTEPAPSAAARESATVAGPYDAPEPSAASVTGPYEAPEPSGPLVVEFDPAGETEAVDPPEPLPVGPGQYTTQNGSARFTVPAGWSGIDRSWSTPDPDSGSPTWINIVELEGPGVRLLYADTPQYGGNWTYDPGTWAAVDARAVGDDDLAQAFWALEDGRYVPHIALTSLQGPNDDGFAEGSVHSPTWLAGSASNYRFEAEFADSPSFGTEAEAVAFLQSAPAVTALEAVASIELTGIDGHTMP